MRLEAVCLLDGEGCGDALFLRTAFRVQSKESHPKDRFPTRRVYGPTAGSTLRLVTCTGAWDASRGHYRDNLIVFAAPA